MREVEIYYWNWQESLDTDDKDSSTDYGKEVFEYIIENEIEDASKLETIQNE